MEVELSGGLLANRHAEFVVILALCAFGFTERHRVVPDDRALWEQWLFALPPILADEVRSGWDESERRIAEGRASERVVVRPGERAEYFKTHIEMAPREALALLGRPFRVILENGRNDRAFILAFADRATRKEVLKAEASGWLVFETGGGIGEVAVRLEAAVGAGEADIFRTMYLTDSDARISGVWSHDASRVRKSLRALAARLLRSEGHFGRVLGRRAAENYAPPGAVLAWASSRVGSEAWRLIRGARSPVERPRLALGTGNPGSPRRRLLAAVALCELAPEIRGFLDMKEGLGQDAARTDGSIWGQLDTYQQAVLRNGFGSSFSAEFYEQQQDLLDETNEVVGFLAKLLERV